MVPPSLRRRVRPGSASMVRRVLNQGCALFQANGPSRTRPNLLSAASTGCTVAGRRIAAVSVCACGPTSVASASPEGVDPVRNPRQPRAVARRPDGLPRGGPTRAARHREAVLAYAVRLVTIVAAPAGALIRIVVLTKSAPAVAAIVARRPRPDRSGDGMSLGRASAPITVDGRRPVSVLRSARQTLQPRIVADFVVTGKVRLVARGSLSAGGSGGRVDWRGRRGYLRLQQGRCWPYRLPFGNQFPTRTAGRSVATGCRVATAVGLDPTRFRACFDDATIRARVVTDTNAAFAKGVSQTPTLVFNGVRMSACHYEPVRSPRRRRRGRRRIPLRGHQARRGRRLRDATTVGATMTVLALVGTRGRLPRLRAHGGSPRL
jgi:hypothetical protein